MKVKHRRPLYDDPRKCGYMESDIDYVKNNIDLCIQFLDNARVPSPRRNEMTRRKELQELKDELKNAKARGEEYQNELEFNRNEQQELETEIFALENNVTQVGLPISSYIRRLIVSEGADVSTSVRINEVTDVLKIFALRIQQLEVEVRKLKR